MTNRQRLLAIMDGKLPDRIPWIPRLGIWHEANKREGALPERHRGLSLREVERAVFGGTAGRDGIIYRIAIDGVEIRTHRLGEMETLTEYVTPVGTVTTRLRSTTRLRQQGIQDAEVEFMLKRREDYPVVEYIVEHTRYTPAFEQYEAYEREVGDDGYPMVNCGDCPMHHWMRVLVGYNQAYFHLNDYTAEVERLVAVLSDHYRENVWKHMLDSPARLLMHGHHLSSQMTPPSLFEQYILPYYRELAPQMRARGKVLALHGDNDTRHIFSHIERAGFGMVECFATHPMVETTLAEARAAWGDRVIIWGGVPSPILEGPFTDEQFEAYMDDLFRSIAPGSAFILGIADNAMPGSKIERIERITEMIEERGAVPM
ncbi:MAG: uroporphyrinogen decarboxylase family protein [Planctomycetota bacterium]